MQKPTKPSRRTTKGQDFRSGKGEIRMPSSAPGTALDKQRKANSKQATNACFTDHIKTNRRLQWKLLKALEKIQEQI